LRQRFNPLRDKKTFHISWLITALSSGILLGTLFSLYISRFSGLEWLVVAGCIAIIGFRKPNLLGVGLLIVAGTFFGFWNGAQEIQSKQVLGGYTGQEVVLMGKVSEDPSIDIDGDIRLRLQLISINDTQVDGEVWAATSQKADVKRSDVVELEGNLSQGFGTIPAAMYRARITAIERSDFADVARDTRDWFADGIREGIREPEASLGAGFLLGQKTALPEKLDNELRLLGLTHIVVASGYNLSILVRYARRLFVKISRYSALAISGFLVYGFANITGFSPSMTRASLITGLSLAAWYFGRKFHPIVLLTVSAAVTVVINPTYIWGDIGWLLSFLSFIGVIILSPLIHAYFWGTFQPSTIRQVFIETSSAQLMTLPLIAYVFGQYSPLAVLANLLVLPLIPVAMGLTFLAGIGGVMLPIGTTIIGWPAETVMGYMTVVVDYLARQPLAGSEISFSVTALTVGYLGLITLLVFLWRRSNHSFRDYNIIE
jgi:competence protein ComEC